MQAADWIDLSGKTALVTGGARGIGAGIAAALAAAGARVIVADRDAAAADACASAIGGRGVALDVGDAAAIDALFAALESDGGLDILVNNAGVYREYFIPVVDMSSAAWRTLMSINLDGVFHCCRAAARLMVAQGRGGRIINVASTQAVSPGAGVAYDASKAAVVQLTRTLALELARYGINVNALAPGATWVEPGQPQPPLQPEVLTHSGEPLADQVTDRIRRIPLGRWGTPQDMGKAALFLASPMSDYLTGVYLPVDGGWLVL